MPTTPSDTKPSVPRPSVPDEVPTQPEIPAVTDGRVLEKLLQNLHEEVKKGFYESADRDFQLVQRVTTIENWKEELEGKLQEKSLRAKEPSLHDVELKKELDTERTKREELAVKVDTIMGMTTAMHTAVVTFWSSTNGKRVRLLITGAIAGWAFRNHINLGALIQ